MINIIIAKSENDANRKQKIAQKMLKKNHEKIAGASPSFLLYKKSIYTQKGNQRRKEQ